MISFSRRSMGLGTHSPGFGLGYVLVLAIERQLRRGQVLLEVGCGHVRVTGGRALPTRRTSVGGSLLQALPPTWQTSSCPSTRVPVWSVAPHDLVARPVRCTSAASCAQVPCGSSRRRGELIAQLQYTLLTAF
jgi:hypothetical protein